ncbi:MAG: J domain-containing protein [Rhodanobacteraceae bacterium]
MTTSHTDFLTLFQELGLPPNCTLDELKLAFRRRVSQLHPDRAAGQVGDAESRLQRLTAMYNAALDFHRRYGRMPGNSTNPTPPRGVSTRLRTPSASPSYRDTSDAQAPQRSNTGLMLLGGLAGLAVIAWLIASSSIEDSSGEIESSTAPPEVEAAQTPPVEKSVDADTIGAPDAIPAPRHLRLGMSRDSVVALEGQPLSTNGPQWDYGPSWVAFRCGRVADWYSSPLRPLRTASTHPLSTDQMPALRAVDCANNP